MATMKPPADLRAQGKKLWNAVHEDYELGSHEIALLREACRATDELDILRTALLDSEVVAVGSTGQPVVNKIFEEIRRHRDSLAKTITAMNLPADDEEETEGQAARSRSEQASKAAKAKWAKYQKEMNGNRG